MIYLVNVHELSDEKGGKSLLDDLNTKLVKDLIY